MEASFWAESLTVVESTLLCDWAQSIFWFFLNTMRWNYKQKQLQSNERTLVYIVLWSFPFNRNPVKRENRVNWYYLLHCYGERPSVLPLLPVWNQDSVVSYFNLPTLWNVVMCKEREILRKRRYICNGNNRSKVVIRVQSIMFISNTNLRVFLAKHCHTVNVRRRWWWRSLQSLRDEDVLIPQPPLSNVIFLFPP